MSKRYPLALIATAVLSSMMTMTQPAAAQRSGSFEFSGGVGAMFLSGSLTDYLTSVGFYGTNASPSKIVAAGDLRLGYNFDRHWGFSIGVADGTGSGVNYLTPFAQITGTLDLNAKTSPFITLGTQVTRITGANDDVTHATWGANVGIGVRRMIGERTALRLEGQLAMEHYEELAGSKTVYPATILIGISVFTGGRHPRTVEAPCDCTKPLAARVDTLRVIELDTVGLASLNNVDQVVLRVQFQTDKTELLPISLPVLNTVATAIMATPGSRWQVEGHTDSIGTRADNKILAQGRAQAVVDYLVSRGVTRDILVPVGFGYDRPVTSNSTEEGRAQNRRVQLRRIPAPPTEKVP